MLGFEVALDLRASDGARFGDIVEFRRIEQNPLFGKMVQVEAVH